MTTFRYIPLLYTLLISGCGIVVQPITDHPLIGQTFDSGGLVYYMEKCNNKKSCGISNVHKHDRTLICSGELNSSYSLIYDTTYEISTDTRFTLVGLLRVKDYGLLQTSYVLAELRDNKNKYSTRLFSLIDQTDKPFGYQNNKICD